MITDSFDSAGI